MPLLKIETNAPLPEDSEPLLRQASTLVAGMLGKPESYVMVGLNANPYLCFAGSSEPLAYVELKSLGLPEDRTAEFSEALCGFLETRLQIPAGRIYIEFSNPSRHLWGWNSGTF